MTSKNQKFNQPIVQIQGFHINLEEKELNLLIEDQTIDQIIKLQAINHTYILSNYSIKLNRSIEEELKISLLQENMILNITEITITKGDLSKIMKEVLEDQEAEAVQEIIGHLKVFQEKIKINKNGRNKNLERVVHLTTKKGK